MLYFAYGSNMSPTQMKERCQDARFVSTASLEGHRLAFLLYSNAWHGGVCGLVRDDADVVWGVVYDLSEEDMSRLDAWEGAPQSYYRQPAQVRLASNGEMAQAETYFFARPSTAENLPSKRYMDRLLEGARHWGLPTEYIRSLEVILTRELVT
ncbi:MAG: hypothetical protein HW403_291 [Dehalococcoidia bacterium]|nr:hypothetical protein [Dehalococcoidia bacterium]